MDFLFKQVVPDQKPEDEAIINALCRAFKDNARMKFLVGSKGQAYLRGLKVIISYCYFTVKKLGGVFCSEKKAAFLLFYRKSEYYSSFYDKLRYMYMAIFVVGLEKLPQVYKREQMIKSHRKNELSKNGDQDFLYVWFLAQKDEEKGLSELIEAKNYILNRSNELDLPIYIETTDRRLLLMYRRIGFKFYYTWKENEKGMQVWFGRRAKDI